jgi:hypothetical protein
LLELLPAPVRALFHERPGVNSTYKPLTSTLLQHRLNQLRKALTSFTPLLLHIQAVSSPVRLVEITWAQINAVIEFAARSSERCAGKCCACGCSFNVTLVLAGRKRVPFLCFSFLPSRPLLCSPQSVSNATLSNNHHGVAFRCV